ncbi:hypothetical protein DNK34_15840 [Pseudomonas dryadis]|uniref:Uncharacterized protein n=1 Tax=Phytopseudomonas dryadis TaxID=2487520 RepID=A0A4Q9R4P4_9GAMM|nr:hypothetical protein DNK44_07840 [Pseudomonas dryadis]TBV03798.1 hypothetical protein DNK34_15840 [Pseudomonas dryadis]TBV16015.1 hypothetical protein DNK41_16405 [Pseudomonas sp. FRB 230]
MLAQEKVSKKKGTPASGSRCARLPSLHRRSGGRRTWAIHGPLRLSPLPCGSSPCTAISLGLLKGKWASPVPSRYQREKWRPAPALSQKWEPVSSCDCPASSFKPCSCLWLAA